MRWSLLLAAAVFISQSLHGQLCNDREIPDDAWISTAITADDAVQMIPRRVLIMRAFWDSGTEALVVEDPGEVEDLFALLAANRTFGHACGFHWGIVFEDSSRRTVEHLHNKNCEIYRNFHDEVQDRLTRYFQRVETAPTHYLLNVELDPAANPAAVAQVLERDGRRAFLLSPPDGRFPQLHIKQFAHGSIAGDEEAATNEIRKRAREKIDALIELLRVQESARVFIEPAEFTALYGGGEYEYGMKATVVFPLAFDASRLARYRDRLATGARDEEMMKALEEEEPSFEPDLVRADPRLAEAVLERSRRRAPRRVHCGAQCFAGRISAAGMSALDLLLLNRDYDGADEWVRQAATDEALDRAYFRQVHDLDLLLLNRDFFDAALGARVSKRHWAVGEALEELQRGGTKTAMEFGAGHRKCAVAVRAWEEPLLPHYLAELFTLKSPRRLAPVTELPRIELLFRASLARRELARRTPLCDE